MMYMCRYVREGYIYIYREIHMVLLFQWWLGTCLFFEVKPLLKKIEGQGTHVPWHDNTVNCHEGFYSC